MRSVLSLSKMLKPHLKDVSTQQIRPLYVLSKAVSEASLYATAATVTNRQFRARIGSKLALIQSKNLSTDQSELTGKNPDTKFQSYVADKMQTHDLFMIGDCHADNLIKELLINQNNMRLFKKCGIDFLFMEMVERKDQKIIDQYYAGEIGDSALKASVSGWTQTAEMPGLLVSIIKAAKENGIQVIGINRERNEDGSPPNIAQRNLCWVDAIEHVFNKGRKGKGLIFGGAAHIGEFSESYSSAESIDGYDPKGVNGLLREKGFNIHAVHSPGPSFLSSLVGLCYVERSRSRYVEVKNDGRICMPKDYSREGVRSL